MFLYGKNQTINKFLMNLGLKEPYLVYWWCFGFGLVDSNPLFVLRKYWDFRGDAVKISPTSDDHNFFVRNPFRMFLDSMEIPLSLESIHIYLDNIGTHIRSINKKYSRPYWLLVATVHGKPPTSDGYNFFVRTPFWMFLDSMEIPLSIESIHIYLDNIETHIRS